jgi:hypothetical protein
MAGNCVELQTEDFREAYIDPPPKQEEVPRPFRKEEKIEI